MTVEQLIKKLEELPKDMEVFTSETDRFDKVHYYEPELHVEDNRVFIN